MQYSQHNKCNIIVKVNCFSIRAIRENSPALKPVPPS